MGCWRRLVGAPPGHVCTDLGQLAEVRITDFYAIDTENLRHNIAILHIIYGFECEATPAGPLATDRPIAAGLVEKQAA
jgi:hypothetical protein